MVPYRDCFALPALCIFCVPMLLHWLSLNQKSLLWNYHFQCKCVVPLLSVYMGFLIPRILYRFQKGSWHLNRFCNFISTFKNQLCLVQIAHQELFHCVFYTQSSLYIHCFSIPYYVFAILIYSVWLHIVINFLFLCINRNAPMSLASGTDDFYRISTVSAHALSVAH